MSSTSDELPGLAAGTFVAPAPPIRKYKPFGRKGKHTVHWFRKGLRFHDNPALQEALKDAATFRCLFLIDPWFAGSSNVGINKWRFLLQCLEDVDRNLRKLNSRLFVVRGQPVEALPKLFQEWGINALTFEVDPEPYGQVRDEKIATKCREIGIKVTSYVSHTLFELDKIIERNGGKAPLTYSQFQTTISGMLPPFPVDANVTACMLRGAYTPLSNNHDSRYGIPTLQELGFTTNKPMRPIWIGGEREALLRLEKHLERRAWVAKYDRPRMTPQSLLANRTGLSPYLRFGCLSTRLFYYKLLDLYRKMKRAKPPISLHGQLLWREFFYCAATRNPNFDHMEGNPICIQIPWTKNPEALAKWANGKTGYPWIDAIMTQLRQEGWIHHLARHAVACFLTRGDLWISWEEGVRVFDDLLLDADWSTNSGMWMWISCSSFFQHFCHTYCPVTFGLKTDPNGDYIRRYVPVLKNMPNEYVHEPWLAPASVQLAAKCIVGEDYPLPMIDHKEAAKINIERLKQIFKMLYDYILKESSNTGEVENRKSAVKKQQSISNPSIQPLPSISQSNHVCAQSPELTTTSSIAAIEYDYYFLRPKYLNYETINPSNKTIEQQFLEENLPSFPCTENSDLNSDFNIYIDNVEIPDSYNYTQL